MLMKFRNSVDKIADIFTDHPWFAAMVKTTIMLELCNETMNVKDVHHATLNMTDTLIDNIPKSVIDDDEALFAEIIEDEALWKKIMIVFDIV